MSVPSRNRKGRKRTDGKDERNDAENAHNEKHTPLVAVASSWKGWCTGVRSSTDASVVENARAKEFDSEEERFLELVVHFRVAHGDVKGGSVRCVLMCGGEEAVGASKGEQGIGREKGRTGRNKRAKFEEAP
jgi:hypothetical protein